MDAASHRRLSSVALSLVLILAAGGLGVAANLHATNRARVIRRQGLIDAQKRYAALTKQYLLFLAKETYDYGAAHPWSFAPGDAADRARLRSFVESSDFFTQGGALVDIVGNVLNAYGKPPGLPSATDPGFAPLKSGLLSGQPGLSSVMKVKGVPMLGVGAPIMAGARPKAVLIGIGRIDTSPLQVYTEQLWVGQPGTGFVVDSEGTTVSAGSRAFVGVHLQSRALRTDGRNQMIEYSRNGRHLVGGFFPVGVGGWRIGAEYSSTKVFGPITAAGFRVSLALIMLLAVSCPTLLWFNRRRRQLEERLRHEAMHDPLTKIANRSLFWDRLDQSLARRRRMKWPLALLYVDLDNFKGINDRFGHSIGDKFLIEISSRLTQSVRPADTVARLGGDEFAVLLDDTSNESAESVAERIAREIAEPAAIDGKTIGVHASMGVAFDATGISDAEDLVRKADIAMYAAKAHGKGRIEVYSSEMVADDQHRAVLAADLAGALDRAELELFYQPIVELTSGRPMGVEALLRWRHPKFGLLMPKDFIPLAEESGIVVTIGRWSIDQAVRTMAGWQARGVLPSDSFVSVNVSVKQLRDSSLSHDIARTLKSTGFDPRFLMLEITETLINPDMNELGAEIAALKALGVRVAIDDFGTGYSSLSHLQSVPADVLKIDGRFVANLGAGGGAGLAEAICKVASTLNLQTIAECIETEDQRRMLATMGCNAGQGFLFAPASRAEDLPHAFAAARSA